MKWTLKREPFLALMLAASLCVCLVLSGVSAKAEPAPAASGVSTSTTALSASAPEILVDLSSQLSPVYAIRMKVRTERSDETVLFTQLAFFGRVAENVMPLHPILPGVHAVIHVICKDAP